MSFLLSSPGTTNLPDVFQKYPKRGIMILHLIDDIMREESPLTDGERELIFTYISGLNSCSFCFHSHVPAATAYGIDESIFGDMKINLDSPKVDKKLQPILIYAKKLTLTPTQVTKADVVNFMNRFVNGVGVDVDPETAHQTGASVLPTIGYSGWAANLEKSLAS
jgi:AhpD family alkylhydroperoxidase